MTPDEFARFVKIAPWRHAKTAPHNPHAYTLAKNHDRATFEAAVLFIREHGHTVKFWRRTYIVYHLDGYRYWEVGDPLDKTTLINRALLAGHPQIPKGEQA